MSDTIEYPSLNSLLGHPEDAKLLLINTDDAGMCHAANGAVVEAIAYGLVQSCTVMVPCPWLLEFVHLKKSNPDLHCGIHLTVTSEWDHYRWGPVLGPEKVPTLIDEQGYLHKSEQDLFRLADPREVVAEFRAQIERAIKLGLEPTHIDSHMGAYHWEEEIFQPTKELADEFGLTMRIGFHPRRDMLRQEGWAVVDRLWFDTYDVPLDQREEYYCDFLQRVEPGVTELVIHCAHESEELQAICGDTASHRVFDFDFFTRSSTKQLLADLDITCISYRDLHELHQKTRRQN